MPTASNSGPPDHPIKHAFDRWWEDAADHDPEAMAPHAFEAGWQARGEFLRDWQANNRTDDGSGCVLMAGALAFMLIGMPLMLVVVVGEPVAWGRVAIMALIGLAALLLGLVARKRLKPGADAVRAEFKAKWGDY